MAFPPTLCLVFYALVGTFSLFFYLLYLRGADIVIITGDWILTSKHLHHHARRSFIVSLVTSAQLR